MRWFEGSIAEAVAKSKAMNAVFIVFVEGTDDMSRELAAALDAPEVSTRLQDKNKFLSIKLSSTSSNYTHFTQIYKFVPVPSVFFIGRDGAPLEVVCGGITPDSLSERIEKILAQHYDKNPLDLTAQGPSTGASVASSSQAFIQAEHQAQSKHSEQPSNVLTTARVQIEEKQKDLDKPQHKKPEDVTVNRAPTESEYEVVCDGDVCVKKPKSAGQPSASEGPSTEQMVTEAAPPEAPSIDTKLERARELIEAKRREKEAKEKELERLKELERRAMGQGVAELKRKQAEQELLDAAAERRKEKEQNALARQRVLDQIAQDRAERKAREALAVAAQPPAAAQSTTATARSDPALATQARIQLKLTDGTTHVATFSADDTIADVHAYIRDNNLVQESREFTLWTTFPRRELPPSAETLRENQLAPSAALLVLAASGTAIAPQPASARIRDLIVTLYTTLILAPLFGAWSWLSARLFPPTAPRGRPRSPSPAAPASGAAPGLRYRPPSNVHRLREDRSSDDENNTWNGNSTQQM